MWLPNSWVAIDLNRASIRQARQSFDKIDTRVGRFMADALQVGLDNGMQLFAYQADRAAIAAGDMTSANVLVVDLPRPLSAEILGPMTEAELNNLDHISEVALTFPNISDQLAAQLTYRVVADGPLGEQILRNQQVILPVEERAYAITFSGPANRYWHFSVIFDTIRESFQLLRSASESHTTPDTVSVEEDESYLYFPFEMR
jgi:hypothetical protein